ncbi:hypothetical protein VTJ04DRAFT_5642 [Mycothermus thermophilus]|uniref:uncharacterized protein n=1 Tax=Humicola insolens TaxID=85995 RepID=UPI003743D005
MATESPKERSDEAAAVTSSPKLTPKVDSDSQNASLDRPQVNGGGGGSSSGDRDTPAAPSPAAGPSPDELENKHLSDIVDDLVNSAEVSVSGGSDNEAAKSDASKTKDSKGRVASTTKKPTSFKAINVNKMFLATKATSASSGQTKTAEKSPSLASATPASSGTTTTSRPRLVAKTGGGLITKGSANGAKPAPDPSAVWNKNRPAPPPEPKKYTDEELRKYGIHMASRLQTSDSKGQSNWADIEDDDDDWGPETITWKDGTKVQIAHVDSHSKTEPAAADKDKEDKADADKNKTTTTAAAAAATATTTASKPGTLGSGKGLVLKSGTSEKPTLVAKPPPAPAPTKSPWAPLPKIEKVSPVAPEAAATEIGPKASPKVPPAHPSPGLRPGPGPQQPPREIAADDFSRAPWRDGPGGGNRELYNSHSGRYEPYDRRGPMRGEPPYGRQPSLMQRPPHHEPHGPMDQGGPFSGRNHEQPGPYGRRRSSNTSTGSGSWQRPTLKSLEHPPPPPELIARRTSTAGGSEGPISPRMPPAGYQGGPRHGQPWQPRTSPGTTHATPYQQPPQAHQPQQPHQRPPPGPDNRGLPPPLHPSPGAPPAVVITEDDIELQKRLMRERRELALKRRQEEEAREEAAKRERIRLKLQALGFPPDEPGNSKKAEKEKEAAASTPTQIQSRSDKTSDKSTAPKEEGEPKVAETPAAGAPTETTGGASDSNLQKSQQQTPTPQPTTSTTPRLPHSDRVSEQQQQQQGQSQPAQAAAQSSTAQHGQGQPTQNHPWAPPSRQSDRHAPPPVWGPQPSSKNVWAPPNHNRSLGNGTFSSDIGPTTQLPPSGPGPIAPPNMTSTNVPRQPPIGPPRQPQRQFAENPWAAAVRESDRKYDDMLKAQYDERDRRLKAEGRSASELQPAIKDTWRPTKLDASGVRVTAAPKQTVQIGQDNPWAASTEAKTGVQNGPSTGAAPDYGQLAQGPVQPARGGSRFFPARQENRDVRPEPAPEPIPQPVVEPILRRDSPSPPPPDMAGHPAFDGDASHPHVSLPPPHPVVRLPPTTTVTTSTQKSTTESNKASSDLPKSPKVDSRPHGAPSFAWAAQAPYKEPERGPTAAKTDSVWQQKIDNLLGVRKGPNRSGADHAPPPPAAQPEPSVPAPSVQPPADLSLSITTKVMDEECFEEQEMGSVPPIRLPKTVPEMAWQPSPSPKPLSKKFFPVVVSADPISFPPDLSGSGPVWRVRLPGGEAKLITVPFGRTRSNPRRSGPRNNRHGPSGQHRPKGREPSAAFSGEQGSGTTGSHGRGHRSGYRSRDNWSRNNGNAQTQT